MRLKIDSQFAFEADAPTDVLLQFEAADIPEQTLLSSDTQLEETQHSARIAADERIGQRIWLRADGRVSVRYRAKVEIERQVAQIDTLDQLPPHLLPGTVVPYLFDSRYCQADRFQSFAHERFGELSGGRRVAAIRDWIADNFTYAPGASDQQTGAIDSFVERRGICRDYAHVLIALARASTIPARYVSCYAPGVTPQDFHAVAEVFLADPAHEEGGTWQIIDATGMASARDTVKIGVGRDAADVSFMTSFGPSTFLEKSIEVREEKD